MRARRRAPLALRRGTNAGDFHVPAPVSGDGAVGAAGVRCAWFFCAAASGPAV